MQYDQTTSTIHTQYTTPLSHKHTQQFKPVDVPTYDFAKHQRSNITRRVPPADVIIIEGILVLHMEQVCDIYHGVYVVHSCSICV